MKRNDTAGAPPVLLNIVKEKEIEVAALYDSGMAKTYMTSAIPRPLDGESFLNAISRRRTASCPNVIAEFKRTSPSNRRNGLEDFRKDADPKVIARLYEEFGVAAMSVLTDSRFKGSLEDFRRIREVVNLLLLRKDFMIDEAQIYEARAFGADAILLIAAILGVEQMREFISVADSLGMDCLVESHNGRELEKALEAGARIIGINNRDLHDLKKDPDIKVTLGLLPHVPEGKPVVSESGILTFDDVQRLSDTRIKAILVGTTLMKATDIPAKMRELRGLA